MHYEMKSIEKMHMIEMYWRYVYYMQEYKLSE